MTAASLPRSIVRPHFFQFRLATLLVAMAWTALVSLALRTPTPLLSGVIASLTLIAVLTAVLVALYRTGRTRATALGFLVFCVGYLWSPSFGNDSVVETLFRLIHLERVVPLLVGGDMILPPSYNRLEFHLICNYSVASVVGVAGVIAAQFLHATQPAAEERA